jgi:hypothetical protein
MPLIDNTTQAGGFYMPLLYIDEWVEMPPVITDKFKSLVGLALGASKGLNIGGSVIGFSMFLFVAVSALIHYRWKKGKYGSTANEKAPLVSNRGSI